mgnify:CR=1 FL=1
MEQNWNATSFSAGRVDFHGWRAIELHKGLIRAVLVPDTGGRIMAYDLGPYPFLWTNSALLGRLLTPEEHVGDGLIAAWKNYGGSKTWPAPQGWSTEEEWHGPPDPVLDSGRYTIKEVGITAGGATACLRSPTDPRMGVQITRQLTLHPGGSRATLHLEMVNASDMLW